jgi:hypothetical protein
VSATTTHYLQDFATAQAANLVAREIPRAIADICRREAIRLGFRVVDQGNGFDWISIDPDRPAAGTAKTMLDVMSDIYLVAGCHDEHCERRHLGGEASKSDDESKGT